MMFEMGNNGILGSENITPMMPVAINIGHSMHILVVGFASRYLSKKLLFFNVPPLVYDESKRLYLWIIDCQ
jgi:hypothetical protein